MKAASASSLEDPDAYDDDDENANKNDEGEGEEEENAEQDPEVPVENDEQPLSTTGTSQAPAVPPQQSAESPAIVQSSTQDSAKAILKEEIAKADTEGGLGIWCRKAWEYRNDQNVNALSIYMIYPFRLVRLL